MSKLWNIYAVRMTGGHVKIGRTLDLAERLRELQRGTQWRLDIERSMTGPPQIETGIHCAFRSHRKQGEWFDVPQNEIRRVFDLVESNKCVQSQMLEMMSLYLFQRMKLVEHANSVGRCLLEMFADGSLKASDHRRFSRQPIEYRKTFGAGVPPAVYDAFRAEAARRNITAREFVQLAIEHELQASGVEY